MQSNANNIKTKAGNTAPWPPAILHSLELSERLSPDFSTVNKRHEVKEPPPMKDQQGKYSNESRTKTGKQAWKLLYKPLTGWEGNYINISLQREYKANTGLFDDSERDSREISDLDRLHILPVGAVGEVKPWLLDREQAAWSQRATADERPTRQIQQRKQNRNREKAAWLSETGLKIAV